MGIASRVVGIVLAVTGLIFVGLGALSLFLFRPPSVLDGSELGSPAWLGSAFAAALGIGLILYGWYYFTLDVEALDDSLERPASRFSLYFITHRRELKLIAQVGLVISLIRLGAACFGKDWPGGWAAWPLVLACIGLAVIEAKIARANVTNHLDWESAPDRVRPVLKPLLKVGGAACWVLVLIWLWNAWSNHKVFQPVIRAALIVVLFTAEALFFAYGETRAD